MTDIVWVSFLCIVCSKYFCIDLKHEKKYHHCPYCGREKLNIGKVGE